jgi:hypothetical protein
MEIEFLERDGVANVSGFPGPKVPWPREIVCRVGSEIDPFWGVNCVECGECAVDNLIAVTVELKVFALSSFEEVFVCF